MKFSVKTGPNHGGFKSVMEKRPQTGKGCRYSHQTDSANRIPRSQKIRISKGFCEDNLPSVNVRTEQSWEGRDRHCFQFRYMPLPGRQTILGCLPKSMLVAVTIHAPAVINTHISIPTKRGCCQERLHPQIIILHLQFYLWFIAFNICPAAAFCSGVRDVQLSNTSFRSGVNSTISPSAKNWDKVMP